MNKSLFGTNDMYTMLYIQLADFDLDIYRVTKDEFYFNRAKEVVDEILKNAMKKSGGHNEVG